MSVKGGLAKTLTGKKKSLRVIEKNQQEQENWGLQQSRLVMPERLGTKETKKKKYAHGCVRHALSSGKLVRQPCEVCNEPRSQAHHDDYSKPLDVKWLCVKHHAERHVELNRLNRKYE